MPIAIGDRIADATFTRMTPQGPAPIATADIFAGRKVVVFAVPGAFTPTCNNKHLPSYLREYEAMRAKGIDTIACVAVNDVFVMDAWARANAVGDKVLMLADGNADFTRKMGLEADLSGFGMGVRSRRYSMVVDDGVVTQLNLEKPGEFRVSAAEFTVCQL